MGIVNIVRASESVSVGEAGNLDACADIGAIGVQHSLLKGQLDLLYRISSDLRRRAQWDEHLDGLWDNYIGQIDGGLRQLSETACDLPARGTADLVGKARLWLERAIPDCDDDVTCLAFSICRDILRLHAEEQRADDKK